MGRARPILDEYGIHGKHMAIQHEYPPRTSLSRDFQQRVLSLQREEDWNGEGAQAITADTCRSALKFTKRALAVKPDLPLPLSGASVFGAVSLLWVNAEKDLSIRVYSDNRVESYFEQADGRYAALAERPDEAIARLIAFGPQPNRL
jgi:hypothetical protein